MKLWCAAVAGLLVACGSDDSSSGPASSDASVTTLEESGASDAGGHADAGAADAAPASEGVVSGTGSFVGTSLAELTSALSEVTSVAQGSELQVVLAQLASCRDVDGGPSANAVFLEISLYTNAPGTDGGTSRIAATAPATYSLDESGPGPYAQAYVIAFDASCKAEAFSSGKIPSGTVTVTSVGASSIVGTYNLTGDVGAITGTFSTVPCTGAYDLVAPASTANCH